MTPALNQLPVVAINASRRDAESLVEALQRARLGVTRLAIVGKSFRTEEHLIGLYAARDQARWRGARGSVATSPPRPTQVQAGPQRPTVGNRAA